MNDDNLFLYSFGLVWSKLFHSHSVVPGGLEVKS